ncbi:MAG: methyltransferase domain-containing protein [Gammaproteobacteria bacterium]|nr:methyltransferase domain-containing protein [Gammaproteobacteria bacterium]
MSSLPSIQTIKTHAIDMMNLKRGDTVLEVGCGQGQDAETIAKKIEPDGTVIARDLSQRMITEAKRRSQSSNVTYEATDIFHINTPAHPK